MTNDEVIQWLRDHLFPSPIFEASVGEYGLHLIERQAPHRQAQIFVFDRKITLESVQQAIDVCTANGIYTMFLFERSLLPADGAEIVFYEYPVLMAIHAMTYGRVYAYQATMRQGVMGDDYSPKWPHVTISSVHLEPVSDATREVMEEPDVELRFHLEWLESQSNSRFLKGEFLVLNFDEGPFWKRPNFNNVWFAQHHPNTTEQETLMGRLTGDFFKEQKAQGGQKYGRVNFNYTSGGTPFGARRPGQSGPPPRQEPPPSQHHAPAGTGPWGILGVDEGCTFDEAKSAYRRMARQYHPDVNPSPDAKGKMQEINDAWNTIRSILSPS